MARSKVTPLSQCRRPSHRSSTHLWLVDNSLLRCTWTLSRSDPALHSGTYRTQEMKFLISWSITRTTPKPITCQTLTPPRLKIIPSFRLRRNRTDQLLKPTKSFATMRPSSSSTTVWSNLETWKPTSTNVSSIQWWMIRKKSRDTSEPLWLTGCSKLEPSWQSMTRVSSSRQSTWWIASTTRPKSRYPWRICSWLQSRPCLSHQRISRSTP